MKQFLTATDLMKYLYDPRIIYFIYVLKIPQAMTTKAQKGLEKYEEFKVSCKRNKIIKELPFLKKIYDVYLISSKLGISTRVDCIAIDEFKKEAYPIQIKYSVKPKVLFRTQKFQVVMEALLIEERLGYKVPFAFVKFLRSGDFIKVEITQSLKEELLENFSEIRDIIEKEKFPKVTSRYKRRETDSVYRNIV